MGNRVAITFFTALGFAVAPAGAENPVAEHQAKWNDLRKQGPENGSGRTAADEPEATGGDALRRQSSGEQDDGADAAAE